MNLKIFLPFEDYTLTTTLKVEEVSKRLEEKIRPKRRLKDFFYGDANRKPYEGYILINDFKISRIIGYKNSFLPVISGLIYNVSGKTHIKVEMKIIPYVLIPTALVIAVLTMASIFIKGFIFSSPFPFLFPLISYLVIYFAFKIESTMSKKFLAKLLEAEQIRS